MDFYLHHSFVALIFALCTAGILTNVFILATNFNNWKTQKTLETFDKILSYIATIRCLLLLHALLLNLLLVFFRHLFQSLILNTFMLVMTLLLNHFILWFSTILCVFYCLKIANCNYKCFIFLKTHISSLVHWFLLASLPISVTFSVPFFWHVLDPELLETTHSLVENTTFTRDMVHPNTDNMFWTFLMGSLPPLVIFFVAIFLLIQSLHMHIRNMRCNGTSFGSPNLDVHFCAIKTMILFLVLYVIYFTCANLLLLPKHIINTTWKYFISILTCSSPFVHSLYVIFINKKLKTAFLRRFHCH
ncbi:taste receptor type 2 member 40-like [Ranitomeya imitator]|uniref:taste receptor type 2 member 40-like n=1 Tax=Ranitomeya imitator TaxID=111125 RepID=UPI0037E96BF0